MRCARVADAHSGSYFYIGLAVRTALAMGINRQPGPNSEKSAAQLRAQARTWWGIYSVEEQAFPKVPSRVLKRSTNAYQRIGICIGETQLPRG